MTPAKVASSSSSAPPPTAAGTSTTSNSGGTSTTSAGRSQHKIPEKTAQMSVLGMDGTDLEMATKTTKIASSKKNNNNVEEDRKKAAMSPGNSPKPMSPTRGKAGVIRHASASSVNSKPWWGKMVWGSKYGNSDDELGETTNYTSLETPASADFAVASKPSAPPLPPLIGEDNSSVQSRATVEDKLRQDCSFFYQGVEDPIQQKRGAALQPLSSALDKVPRVLSSRDGAIFHAKYQKLNQAILTKTDDLELTESEEYEERQNRATEVVDFCSERSHSISDIQNSSLCYEQNGRLLMKLPRDQMRLIMDYDLEPGIVSVEQCRFVDANEVTPSGEAVAAAGPPLRYVMTVPDDLYRRVFSEMSYHFDPPYLGFFKCCHETENADIRLALVILLVFMILLFIGTMDWPTD